MREERFTVSDELPENVPPLASSVTESDGAAFTRNVTEVVLFAYPVSERRRSPLRSSLSV